MAEHEHGFQTQAEFFFHLGRLFEGIIQRLDHISSNLVTKEQFMAAIDDLRAAQADGTAAITDLGALITAEADQVAQILADLVAAVGNQVTAADVQAAVDSAARIRAAGVAIAAIAPDAVAPPADVPPAG